MNIRLSSWAVGALVVAAVVLMPSRSSATFFALGPSSDDWGMKYDVVVSDANSDTLNVEFTLSDHGRLKPVYSVTVVAFSKLNPDGGRSYLIKERITRNRRRTVNSWGKCRSRRHTPTSPNCESSR